MKAVQTSNAIVEMVDPAVVVCRYVPGARVTAAGIAENIKARLQLVGDAPHVAVTILSSPEEFDMTMLQADHYAGFGNSDGLRASAMVVNGAVMAPLVGLYFACFPPRFKSRVFANEEEAMAWVREQHAGLHP